MRRGERIVARASVDQATGAHIAGLAMIGLGIISAARPGAGCGWVGKGGSGDRVGRDGVGAAQAAKRGASVGANWA